MEKTKTFIGEVLNKKKNCACGETKQGFCSICKTTAKDVIIMKVQEEWEVCFERPAPA